MRERSTWTHEEVVKKVAAAKKAAEKPGDIYTMNQDHPQPAFDAYVTGDPSDFAEDVHSPNEWEKEYKGDEVKRNEIGMPEMRADTFNHSEKTASRETMLKKADLCVEIATLMLQGRKTASESAIEDQAVALMHLPDQELINTHARLAADQDGDDDGDEDQGQHQQQSKQGGEVPPQFLEHMKKKEDGEDNKEEAKDQGEKKQAQQQGQSEEDKDQQGQKQAQQQSEEEQHKDQQGQKQAQQSKKDDGGDQNAKAEHNWPTKEAAQDMMAQMQQMQAQLQQMMQAMQGAPQQAPMAHEQDLDQLLAADSCGPMAEVDIQMDPFMDDMGGVGEDETLRALFANEDEQQDDGQQQMMEEQQQDKQAAVRTASTRTVGTRPTSGVSKIGGASKVAGTGDASVNNLSSLWQTAPDVRGAFGLK